MDHREGRAMRQLPHSCGTKPQGSGSGFADCARCIGFDRLRPEISYSFGIEDRAAWPTLMQGDEPVGAKFRF
jgi:hypothetical protein